MNKGLGHWGSHGPDDSPSWFVVGDGGVGVGHGSGDGVRGAHQGGGGVHQLGNGVNPGEHLLGSRS